MVNPLVLDIVAIVLILIAVIEGRSRGFVRMLWRVGAWLVTLVLVLILVKPVTEWAMTTDTVQKMIYNFSHEFALDMVKSNVNSLTPEKISEITNIPVMLIPENWGSTVPIEDGAVSLAQNVAAVLVKLVTALGLFIVIRILMSIVFRILNLATKLPIIKGVNRLLGMVMGLINIMFIFYIVLGAVALCIDSGSQWDIAINSTYIVKYFYNNNILLNLINL